MFDDRKVGQVAAYFLDAAGGRLPVIKLVKLIYLADRESLDRYGLPITFDRLVAMPHGPVNSQTYDCIQGAVDRAGWNEWVSERVGHDLTLRKPITRDALDELSNAELAALSAVWERFGPMPKWTLRDWTHDNCAEWRDPNGSSRPIEYIDVLRALGHEEIAAVEAAAVIEQHQHVDELFARL